MKLVYGRAGSGKSNYCMNEIKKYSHQAVQSKDLIQGAAKPQKTEKQIAAKNAAKAKGF